MTVSSCAGSRSPEALNDKEFGKIIKQATGSAKPDANFPKRLEPTARSCRAWHHEARIKYLRQSALGCLRSGLLLSGYTGLVVWEVLVVRAVSIAECLGPSAHPNS
jgi:hypothetical protein